MLDERTAIATRHDAAADVLEIDLQVPAAATTDGTRAPAQGVLLLDREGRLVGIDLRPDPRVKAVIMLGPHEAVARQVAARLELLVLAGGAVRMVRVPEASASLNLGEGPRPR